MISPPHAVTQASVAEARAARYQAAHDHGRALAELCRLQISRVPCLIMAVTAVAAGAGPLRIVAGSALIAATCSIGAALNDWADVESDRTNGRFDRPLVSGRLGWSDVVMVVGGGAAIASLAQLILPQPTGLAVTCVAALIGWSSASRPLALQRRGALGPLTLGGAYLVLPVCLALGFGAFLDIAPIALLGAGALAHKDVRDEVGDRAAGKRTLLVQVGYTPMAWIAAGAGALGVVGLGVTIGPGWWVPPAIVCLLGLGVLAADRHRPSMWLVVRACLVLTAILAGTAVAAS